MKLKFFLLGTVLLSLLSIFSCNEADDPVYVIDSKWKVYSIKNGLSSDSILSLAEDPDGVIWCGTQNGICILKDSKSGVFEQRESGFKVNSIVCADSYVIIATSQGGYVLDEGNWYYINEVNKNCIDIEYNNQIFWCLYDDGDIYLNDTYAGNLPELNDIYIKEDSVFYCGFTGAIAQQIGSEAVNRIGPDTLFFCNTSYKSEINELWVGIDEDKGLAKVSNGSTTYLNCGYIKSISQDFDGNMWFGSSLYGVYKLEKDGNLINYTLMGGLPSNRINDILVSKDGSIWVATEDAGIAQLKQ